MSRRPRLVAPVDHLAETGPLLAAGATDLYGGWIPEAWRRRYSLLASANQRTFAGAQIDSREDLAGIVRAAHEAGGRFSLTLNAPFYSDGQLPLLLDLVGQAVAAGIDGVILADPGLLRRVRREYPRLTCQASTLARLTNSAAARLFAAQGVSRVVLPRHLPVAELAAMVRAVPELAFEAFILIGKCPNTEGLCTHHHAAPDKVWPCERPWDIEPLDTPPASATVAAMARQASWAASERRHGCGLCALPALLEAGIAGLKVVGRGAPTAQKVRNIRLVREFLERAEQTGDTPAYRRRARAAHRRRFAADCCANVCYYPEYYEQDPEGPW